MPSTIRLAMVADGLVWVDVTIAENSLADTTWTVTRLDWSNGTPAPAYARAMRTNGNALRDAIIPANSSGGQNITGSAASRQYTSIELAWPA